MSLFERKVMVSGCYTGDGGDGDAAIIVSAEGQGLSTLILEHNSSWPPRIMCAQLCNVYMAAPYLQNTRQPNLFHHPSFEIARQVPRPSFLILRPRTTTTMTG